MRLYQSDWPFEFKKKKKVKKKNSFVPLIHRGCATCARSMQQVVALASRAILAPLAGDRTIYIYIRARLYTWIFPWSIYISVYTETARERERAKHWRQSSRRRAWRHYRTIYSLIVLFVICPRWKLSSGLPGIALLNFSPDWYDTQTCGSLYPKFFFFLFSFYFGIAVLISKLIFGRKFRGRDDYYDTVYVHAHDRDDKKARYITIQRDNNLRLPSLFVKIKNINPADMIINILALREIKKPFLSI